VLAGGFLALVASGCGGTAHGARTRSVVAAFYPLAFAAQTLGGHSVSVHNLTPPGAEPHDIELTPKDVARVETADVVLYMSHDFQPAVQQAADHARGIKIDALAGVAHLRNGVGDEAGKSDPHIWLDPVLFARVVRRIGAVLGEPRRARNLVARLHALDRSYRRGLARCAGRDFVTSHAAFGYLAARYGLHQFAITGVDPESEPSPQTLKNLIQLVRRLHIRTVFFEKLVSSKLAQTVARDAGAKAALLDPVEGLTSAEQANGADYFTIMRNNLVALRTALRCR
jgi:zinc transport system substrate-binding protein